MDIYLAFVSSMVSGTRSEEDIDERTRVPR